MPDAAGDSEQPQCLSPDSISPNSMVLNPEPSKYSAARLSPDLLSHPGGTGWAHLQAAPQVILRYTPMLLQTEN